MTCNFLNLGGNLQGSSTLVETPVTCMTQGISFPGMTNQTRQNRVEGLHSERVNNQVSKIFLGGHQSQSFKANDTISCMGSYFINISRME